MPANDESIRRRWYSVVPERPGQSVDVQLLAKVFLDKIDKPVECRDHKASFDLNWPRAPDRGRPPRSDPIM